jgi:hypothetical protein
MIDDDTQKAINECTRVLLQNPSSLAKWLNSADKYMQTFAADPGQLLLPNAHAFMEPIIRTYAHNTEEFIQYLLYIRDTFGVNELTREHVQNIRRRVTIRHAQQVRRERSSRATAKAKELYGENSYHARLKWVSDLEHGWAQRRLAFLAKHRSTLKGKKIDAEARADLLAEFWDIIDTEIFEGEIPPWN